MIQIKTPQEIEAMREACRISAGALRVGGEAVKPGATTADVDEAIYRYIVSQGAKPNFKGLYGFPGSACISVNEQVIHGVPSKKVILREGDIVSIDTGAAIYGWNGDNAATFACGIIDQRACKLIDVTREALQRAIAAAIPGNHVGDISAAVQEYVQAHGFSVVRSFVGHGIGRELHEAPEVPNYRTEGRGPRLVSGMVLAIEPMINQKGHAVKTLSDDWTVVTADGALSAHFEHTVAITPEGPLVLTQEP